MTPITGTSIVTLGEQLRLMRQRAKMSQVELAEKAQVHRNTVAAVERDAENVTIDTLNAIFAALGYSVVIDFKEKEPVSHDEG
jgi:transcriptional regulator with XRE-family HTH domain